MQWLPDLIRPPRSGDMRAMTDPTQPRPEDPRTTLLLEQLLQIARISALEEMASGIAHELNQPIGAIATFAQAARRMLDRPDPMVRPSVEVLQHIAAQALNAGQGIHRIRARFDGHYEGRIECALPEVIGELAPVLRLLADRRGAALTFYTQEALPRVVIDRLRIQHVLLVLVQNALEAPTPDNERAQVHVAVSGDRYGVQVAVEDRGAGIDDGHRPYMFSPFFTTKSCGTGLGLASSRAIAEAHEGSMVFENINGGGARFMLRLPAALEQKGPYCDQHKQRQPA